MEEKIDAGSGRVEFGDGLGGGSWWRC